MIEYDPIDSKGDLRDATGGSHPDVNRAIRTAMGLFCVCQAPMESFDAEWSGMWFGFGSAHLEDPWIIQMVMIARFAMLE